MSKKKVFILIAFRKDVSVNTVAFKQSNAALDQRTVNFGALRPCVTSFTKTWHCTFLLTVLAPPHKAHSLDFIRFIHSVQYSLSSSGSSPNDALPSRRLPHKSLNSRNNKNRE
jgi:hypothetical protein